jgi:hypoxia up-regulated 1
VDAIEIAGLRTLALVNDGTAVAVNYAMTRTFPEPEVHIIYDAGASAIRTTLVEFSTVESTGKGKPKPYTQVNVLSSGFDRRSGGTELDRRLVKILVEDFMNKNQIDITKDKRAMSKFRKEANRLKAILSANSEAVSTVSDLSCDASLSLYLKPLRSRVHTRISTTAVESSGLNSKPLPVTSKSDSSFPSTHAWLRPA